MKTYYELDCELAAQNLIDEKREAAGLPSEKKFKNMLTDAMFTYLNRYYLADNTCHIHIKTMFMRMDKTKAKELLDLAEYYKEFYSHDIKTYRDLIN
ncbi:MAG: hypothetical protein ABUK08_00410 [Candidatus Humimicrobiaceae bacterium]